MDLGDLSSLWRNSWEPFLNELCRYQDSLGCNMGRSVPSREAPARIA